MKKNFYEERLELINNMYKENKIKDAYKLIIDELEMPYVPSIYEEKFISIKNKIELELDRNITDNMIMSIDRVMELLFGDEKEQILAIDRLKNHNLRPFSKELKRRMETWKKTDSVKAAILYEILALQDVSLDMVFDGQKINSSNGSILDNHNIIIAIKTLEVLSNKEPQYLESGISLLNRYVLGIFPKKIKNGEKIAKSIFNINKLLVTGKNNLKEDDYKIKKVLDSV